jgi:hypothetical protein
MEAVKRTPLLTDGSSNYLPDAYVSEFLGRVDELLEVKRGARKYDREYPENQSACARACRMLVLDLLRRWQALPAVGHLRVLRSRAAGQGQPSAAV